MFDDSLLHESERTFINEYLSSGLKYDDFLRINAHHPGGCGDDFDIDIVCEVISFKKPFYFYMKITNYYDGVILLDTMKYKIADEEEIFEFPQIRLKKDETLLIPIGQFLEHTLENYDYEMGENSFDDRIRISYKNNYNKEAKYFGNSIVPLSFNYKISTEFYEFIPHEFDLNKVFYLDWTWMCGSCPQVFVNLIGEKYEYFKEILIDGQDRITTSEIIIPFDMNELVISEIEDETTFIENIKINDILFYESIILLKGNYITLYNLKKNDIIVVKGSYHPIRGTMRNYETLFLRNHLIKSHTNNLNIINTGYNF